MKWKIDYQKRQKITILSTVIIFAILCIVAVGLFLYQYISRIGKVEVAIYYAPFMAEVKLDAEILKNTATNYVEPGTHILTVSADGFETIEKAVEITAETEVLYGSLTANSSLGEKLIIEYADDFAEVSGFYAAESVATGDQERLDYPIIAYLPVSNDPVYSLGYTTNADGIFTITVHAYESFLDVALAKLASFDQSEKTLAEYNIEIEIKLHENVLADSFIDNSAADPLEFLTTGYDAVDCTLSPGQNAGEYYYTTIITGSAETYSAVTYRVILQKSGDSWRLASSPAPILTVYNTPDVPLEILNAANML